MKRHKRLRRIRLPSIARGLGEAIFRNLAVPGAVIIFLSASFFLGKAFVYRSDYFRLTTVETGGAFLDQGAINFLNGELLNIYKGTNVFRLDLKGIARSIQRSYPDAREIAVRIALPDKLAVSIKFRKPIAVLRGNKSYPIDEDGFPLPSMDAGSLKDLPVIEGVSARYDERRQRPSRNLNLALGLLREIKKSRPVSGYGVVTIDAKDPGSLSFYLRNGIEVRMGCENFGQRIQILEDTLKDPRLALDRIKYIDVRFKDVIIGPK